MQHLNPDTSTTYQELSGWKHQVFLRLNTIGCQTRHVASDPFSLLLAEGFAMAFHLVDVNNTFEPPMLIELQAKWKEKGIQLIQLWEDVWAARPEQVMHRISALMGLNTRIHGRQTLLSRIDKKEAENFLERNHLQGYVNSRYKFGLYYKSELVAVATFSALRKMNHSPNYHSAELIRFAVQAGFSINGGLSKVIKHFAALLQPNDLMTYADRDWSAGKAYLKLGFNAVATLSPAFFELDGSSRQHLIGNSKPVDSVRSVFNTGSIKYILKF